MTTGSTGRSAARRRGARAGPRPSGSSRVEQVRADELALLAEDLLAGLADRVHDQLVRADQERGAPPPAAPRAGRSRITPIPQRSHTRRRSSGRPADSRPGGRSESRSGSARPPVAGRSPRPVDPGESRHSRRSEHGSNASRCTRCIAQCTEFGPELRANATRTLEASARSRASLERMAVQQELWGPETSKAVENFQVSGERVPVPVVRWLGRIKAEAARVNAELGLLDAELAERIARAGDEVAAGEHDDQFPIDVFQTGSGHLLEHERQRGDRQPRRRRRPPQRSREHGAVLQRRLPLRRAPGRCRTPRRRDLLPALERLAGSLERKADELRRRGQGRAHPHDGRRAGDARPGVRRLRGPDDARPRPRAATRSAGRADPARRHGHRHRPEHPPRVRRARAREARPRRGPARPLRGPGQPRRPRRAARGAQGRGRVAHQDRQRPRADGLGPAHRARGAPAARAAEGLVDHARQGQPGDPRGGAAGGRAGDRQRRRGHRRRHARATSS